MESGLFNQLKKLKLPYKALEGGAVIAYDV
jgi:hypothetical protein